METKQAAGKASGRAWVRRILAYCAGLLLLAIAVAIAIQSNLGLAPVTSVPYVLGTVLGVETGNMTIIVFVLYTLLQVLLLGRAFRPLQLLQAPVAVLFGKFVTVARIWVGGWIPGAYWEQLLMVLLSTVLIGVAIKLYLAADIVPQAGDGLVQTLAKKTGLKLGLTKNLFDLASVAVSFLVGWIVTGQVIGVREGTLIAALGVGRVIALLSKYIERPLHAFLNCEPLDRKAEPEPEQTAEAC